MVLFNHTGSRGFLLFTVSRESPLYMLYLSLGILTTAAVPLFFMISGALLLGKEEDYPHLLKRFVKYVLVLLVISLVYYFYQFRASSAPFHFSIKEYLVNNYVGPASVALWYLYVYLAFILMLPFLRSMARGLDNLGFQWLILTYAFISLLPAFDYLVFRGKYSHYSLFQFFISTQYCFYPLLGFYLEHRLKADAFSNRNFLILTAASVLAILCTALFTHWKCSITNDWGGDNSQSFFRTLIFIPAFTIYFGVKRFFERHPPGERTGRLLSSVGGAAFGLFLLERICRAETEAVFLLLSRFMPTLIACWLWIFVACTIGIIATLLLKRIKIFAKFL